MKNCPKCNAKVAEKDIVAMEKIIAEDNIGHFYVRCPKCDHQGAIYPVKSDATWAWDYASDLAKKQAGGRH